MEFHLNNISNNWSNPINKKFIFIRTQNTLFILYFDLFLLCTLNGNNFISTLIFNNFP